MATGGELEEVEGVDGGGFDARDVAEGADEFLSVLSGVVDDQWPTALAVTAVSQFSFASAEFAGAVDFVDVRAGADCGEELEGCGGFGDAGVGEGFGGDDEGDFGDGGDLVAAG